MSGWSSGRLGDFRARHRGRFRGGRRLCAVLASRGIVPVTEDGFVAGGGRMVEGGAVVGGSGAAAPRAESGGAQSPRVASDRLQTEAKTGVEAAAIDALSGLLAQLPRGDGRGLSADQRQ